MTKKANDNLYRGSWTKEEVTKLKRAFPHFSTLAVAVALGRPQQAVRKKASRLGLKKSKKYLKSLGRT